MQTTPTMRLFLLDRMLFGQAQGPRRNYPAAVFAQLNLNVTSFGEHSRFWTGALGATPIKSPDPKVAILSRKTRDRRARESTERWNNRLDSGSRWIPSAERSRNNDQNSSGWLSHCDNGRGPNSVSA